MSRTSTLDKAIGPCALLLRVIHKVLASCSLVENVPAVTAPAPETACCTQSQEMDL